MALQLPMRFCSYHPMYSNACLRICCVVFSGIRFYLSVDRCILDIVDITESDVSKRCNNTITMRSNTLNIDVICDVVVDLPHLITHTSHIHSHSHSHSHSYTFSSIFTFGYTKFVHKLVVVLSSLCHYNGAWNGECVVQFLHFDLLPFAVHMGFLPTLCPLLLSHTHTHTLRLRICLWMERPVPNEIENEYSRPE